jgi:hypothetical protein
MRKAGQASLPGLSFYRAIAASHESAQITKYFHQLQTSKARCSPIQSVRVLMSFTKMDIGDDIFHAPSTFHASATRMTAPDVPR